LTSFKEICEIGAKKLTSIKGSHAKLFEFEDGSSTIPVGGPRKLSQTSRNRDSSASLQSFHNHCLVCNSPKSQRPQHVHVQLQKVLKN
jgi:hypothetical protein